MLVATDFIEVDDYRVLVLTDVLARSKTHEVDIPVQSDRAREAAGLSD